jgi:hypothetical protein
VKNTYCTAVVKSKIYMAIDLQQNHVNACFWKVG